MRIELQRGLDSSSRPAASRISHLPLFPSQRGHNSKIQAASLCEARLWCISCIDRAPPAGRRLQRCGRIDRRYESRHAGSRWEMWKILHGGLLATSNPGFNPLLLGRTSAPPCGKKRPAFRKPGRADLCRVRLSDLERDEKPSGDQIASTNIWEVYHAHHITNIPGIHVHVAERGGAA